MDARTLQGRCRRLMRELESAILPRRCVFCGSPTSRLERHVCRGCDGDLPRNTSACRACALPLADAAAALCGGCQGRHRVFTAVLAPLLYRFPVDAAIRAFKFHRRLFYVPAFADLLCGAVGELPAGIDAVQPVPLHRWRHLRRGFNQARELALPVARDMGLPVIDAVRRCRHTPYQSGLEASVRRRNLNGAFTARGPIAARHVLLVDDVFTTGSTCRQVARVLRTQGVGEISVLALARAVGELA
jgi:ComF family protein